MSKHKVKIAQDWADITSTDLADYKFHSDYPTQCIKERGVLTFTTDGTIEFPATQYTYAQYRHNFGYIPQFMCFTTSYMSDYDDKFSFADYVNLDYDITHFVAGADIQETLRAYATNEYLVVEAQLYAFVSGMQLAIEHTYNVDYLLFMEEAI